MNVAVVGASHHMPQDVKRALRASKYHATRLREVQTAAELRGAEAVVVLWDGHSAETRRLLDHARSLGVPVRLWLMEKPA